MGRPVAQVFVFALYTALATGLGALPFLAVRQVSARVVAYANAIAAGLMLGASLGLVAEGTRHGGWETFVGANVGVAFILLTQRFLGEHDVHVAPAAAGARPGATAGARRMALIVVVMTVHSFAEGVAVGVAFGGGAAVAGAITLAIAVHNVPEGLAISAVLRPRGVSVPMCAWWSVASSLPQPLMAVPAFLFVEQFAAALPYGLGFAAGAMVFMVLVELLPEALEQARAEVIASLTSLTLVGMMLLQRYL